jgi:hypothetical protein
MVTEQLLVFIKNQRSLGVTKDAIVAMLSGQGWTSLDIDQAFTSVNPAPPAPPAPIAASVPTAAQPSISTPVSVAPAISVQNTQPAQPQPQTAPVVVKSHSKRNIIVTTVVILVFISLIITATALYLAGFFFHPAPVNTQFTTTNLLVNPGAETGNLTGWTTGMASTSSVDNGSFDKGLNPHSGKYDFVGHTGALATLSQTVSLVGNQGITATMVDSGNLFASTSFWEQGLYQGDPSDDGDISLAFLDASKNAISTTSTPVIDSDHGAWENSNNQYPIPLGTRYIQYTMNFIRNQGSDNDAFIDDNSLIVTNEKH